MPSVAIFQATIAFRLLWMTPQVLSALPSRSRSAASVTALSDMGPGSRLASETRLLTGVKQRLRMITLPESVEEVLPSGSR